MRRNLSHICVQLELTIIYISTETILVWVVVAISKFVQIISVVNENKNNYTYCDGYDDIDYGYKDDYNEKYS